MSKAKIGVSAVVLSVLGVLVALVALTIRKAYATDCTAQNAEKAVGKLETRVRVNEVKGEQVDVHLKRFEMVQDKIDDKVDELGVKMQKVLDRTHIH